MTDQPIASTYLPPVDQLLTLPIPDEDDDDWQDYSALGLSAEHIPTLIRMALDPALGAAKPDSSEAWATRHAVRALGQLHTPAAIAALGAYLLDGVRGEEACLDAADGLKEIAEEHPEARADVIAAIAAGLEQYAAQSEAYNALLVSDLMDLRAVEALPTIEKAFAANKVDVMVQGDFEDVQIDLGVIETHVRKGPHLKRRESLFDEFADVIPTEPVDHDTIKAVKAKTKAKRKQAEKSRKMNRKKHK